MAMHNKGLTKLVEECGELVQICSKKMACLNSDTHWDGNGSLKERMTDEMGDVIASILFVVPKMHLDMDDIMSRAHAKHQLFLRWDKEKKSKDTDNVDGEE